MSSVPYIVGNAKSDRQNLYTLEGQSETISDGKKYENDQKKGAN